MPVEETVEETKKPKRLLDRTAKDDPEEVSLEDEEETEDEPEAPAAAGPTRTQKKRDRFRELRQEAEGKTREAEERAVRAEARAAAIETNYRLDQDRRQRDESANREDPYAKKDKELGDEQQRLVDQFEAHQRAGTLTPEVGKTIRERAVEVQKLRMDNHLDRKLQNRGPGQDAVTSQNVGQHVIRSYITANYPDVVADDGAKAYAHALHMRMVRRDGKPDSQETLDEAMQQTRKEYLGQQSRGPSAAVRRGATGVPVGGGGGASSGGTPKSYSVTAGERKMARAAYPLLDGDAAVKHWLKTVKPWEKDE